MREQGGLVQQMILGILRHVLTALAGWLVAKGTIDASWSEPLVGGAVALSMVGWSLVEKHRSVKLRSARDEIISGQENTIHRQTQEIRSLER